MYTETHAHKPPTPHPPSEQHTKACDATVGLSVRQQAVKVMISQQRFSLSMTLAASKSNNVMLLFHFTFCCTGTQINIGLDHDVWSV